MKSRLKILGCSGGFGQSLRTTSFLWNDDVLIDAGTGVGVLSLEALLKIDQVFLTHSHLDHIVSIPFLADAVGAKREKPLVVRGLPETLNALQKKIFSDEIWPDFTAIPSPEKPFVRLEPIEVGKAIDLPGGRNIFATPVNHVLPAVGYLLRSAQGGGLAFSGDTTSCPEFWAVLANTEGLAHVIVETSFRNAEIELARVSKHYCPALLAQDLKHFKCTAMVHISHMKPRETQAVMAELKTALPGRDFLALHQDDELSF